MRNSDCGLRNKETSEPWRPRPRFSLLTLLLLTTIAALGAALWRLGSEVVPLREEVRSLRDELGILQIDEPEKIHAIRVETHDDSLYKFRVYLPKGGQYSFNYAYSDIPTEGLPTPGGKEYTESGEYLVTVRIRYRTDPATGKRSSYADAILKIKPTEGQRFSSSVSIIGIGGSDSSWIVNKETGGPTFLRSPIIGKQVERFQADEPVDLIRIRAARPVGIQRGSDGKVSSYTQETIEKPCDGFALWIEAVSSDGVSE